jgi:UDP-glucose 4-epimerase
VYGPRQDSGLEGGVVAVFLERMTSGAPTTIFGDGEQVRDFVFVGDVVDAMLQVAGTESGTYNVGSGAATSINEIHRACAAVAGVPDEPRYEAGRSGDLRRSELDVSAIKHSLGWSPQVSLADGLRETIAWMQESGASAPK